MQHPIGAMRLTTDHVAFSLPTDDGRVVDVGFDIPGQTAQALRHAMAAHLDPDTGRRRRCARPTIIERALQAAGAAIERVEVRPGDPARLTLVMADPQGRLRRLDLDLLDTAELLASHRVPVVAIGWPERDWDADLRALLD